MFELNNLALTVPAPVARYKHMLLHPTECGVDGDDAAAALTAVTPLLEALGEAADQPAEVSVMRRPPGSSKTKCLLHKCLVRHWICIQIYTLQRCTECPALTTQNAVITLK